MSGVGTTINEAIAVEPVNGDPYMTGSGLGDVTVVNPDATAIPYTIPVDGDGEGITDRPANGDFYTIARPLSLSGPS